MKKESFFCLPKTTGSKKLWTRELLVLFYLMFFGFSFLEHVAPGSRVIVLGWKIAKAAFAPGMFFACGLLVGELWNKEDRKKAGQGSEKGNLKGNPKGNAKGNPKGFSRALRGLTLLFLGIYMSVSFITECFVGHRAVYSTIKDLLALIRVPDICSIFLSLAVLLLICSFLWEPLCRLRYRKAIIIGLSIFGILCTWIPEGILGYGMVGIFVGGDLYDCFPIAYYLFVFFWGAYLTGCFDSPVNTKDASLNDTDASSSDMQASNMLLTDPSSSNIQSSTGISLFNKQFWIIPIAAFILGGALGVLHQKGCALVLLGTACAAVLLVIGLFILPVYGYVEDFILLLWKKLKSMRTDMKKKQATSRPFDTFVYYIGYTGLFVVIAYFIFLPYIESGTTLIWEVDGLGQYVPKIHRFMSYIPSVIRDVLHGNMNFKQYDFSSGLGATVAISFDPIYWLNLLFDTSHIEKVYSGMIVLRFFLAGASMSALVLYFKRPHYTAYTASMVYAFSGYAIYAGTKHGQFLTPLMLLPILVIAMEQLISKRKWYLMSILVALSLLCSYYFLYMNTIALGIYFVLRILCTKEYRNFKTFFTRGLIIVGSYALGASMGIISLFTQFASYMGSSRTEGSSLSGFLTRTPLFYRPEWISDYFISYISDSFTPGMWLKLGFAPLAMFAVILLFTRKNKKELKPIFVIFTLFCIFPIFGYIFSGFSSVNNRWCYIYAAVVAIVLAENLEHIPRLTGNEMKIMVSLTSIYGAIIFFSTKYHSDKVFGAYGLMAITLVIILMLNQEKLHISGRQGKLLLFGVTMLTIIFNANMFITSGDEDGGHLDTYVKSGTSEKRIKNTALRYLENVTDDSTGFYRSTNLNTLGGNRSSSMLLGYNDLSTFTSTLGGGIVDYNSAMGNCDWNIVSIYSYNARTIMNELASVRYLGLSSTDTVAVPYGYKKVFEKQKKKKKNWMIYENEFALPLGYTYSNIISAKEASGYSAAEKQELTMLNAVVADKNMDENTNLTTQTAAEIPLTAHKLAINKIKYKGVALEDGILTIPEEGGSITLTFAGEPNSETYVSFDGDIVAKKDAAEHFIKMNVKAGDVKYQYKFRIDAYSTGQDEFLYNLGYHEDGLTTCRLIFKSGGTIRLDDLSLYSQSMDTYADRVAALKANSLEHVKTSTNAVSGDITVDEDKMLVITLPYQTGWTAYVDGQKAKIQRVNYQYMGLNLTSGTHKIELRYQIPGIKLAFLITGFGIVVFVGIILFNFVRKRRRSSAI